MRTAPLLLLLALFFQGCAFEDLDLSENTCPCAVGFTCVSNMCVTGPGPDVPTRADVPLSTDGGADRAQGGDAVDSGASVDAGPPDAVPDAEPDVETDAGFEFECLVPLSDEFEGSALDTIQWRTVNDGDSTVVIGGGLATMTVPAMAPGNYAFIVSQDRIDLSRCAVFVQLAAPEASNTALTFFAVRVDGGNDADWQVRGSRLRATTSLASEGVTVIDIAYDVDEHRWLAIYGAGAVVVWLTSPDGRVWTEQGRQAPGFVLTSLELIFGLGALADGPEISSRFDNLNLVP